MVMPMSLERYTNNLPASAGELDDLRMLVDELLHEELEQLDLDDLLRWQLQGRLHSAIVDTVVNTLLRVWATAR